MEMGWNKDIEFAKQLGNFDPSVVLRGPNKVLRLRLESRC
jgi:hypothetical protein